MCPISGTLLICSIFTSYNSFTQVLLQGILKNIIKIRVKLGLKCVIIKHQEIWADSVITIPSRCLHDY